MKRRLKQLGYGFWVVVALLTLNGALAGTALSAVQGEDRGTCGICSTQQGFIHCCKVQTCDGAEPGEVCCHDQQDCFHSPD